MIGGALGYKYRPWSPDEAEQQLFWFPGPNVAGAWDGFLCCPRLDLLCLAAKLSHMGVTWRGYTTAIPSYEL
jgi:hypothetical protein